VSTTPDGDIIIISCEGEPSDNDMYPLNNPRGSMGYINVSHSDMDDWEYTNIGFTDFDYGGSKSSLLPDDVYIPLPDSISADEGRFSMSAEPEYAVSDSDGKYAYIALQENNAIAVMDIMNKEIINVFSLGVTDFGRYGGLDPSDKDDGINITEYSNVYGMRQPDSIDFHEMPDGRKFIFTANEGDSKDWDEIRVEDIDLVAEMFEDTLDGNMTVDELQEREYLGRLQVSNLLGRVNDSKMWNETEYETLVSFSSRDFTVFQVISDEDGVPIDMILHFNSGNDFEMITAAELPEEGFNSDYFTDSFDSRSDAKGPEPEALTVGECTNGRLYVFIAFEKVGGIIAYDFTDIDNITYVQYVNNRNFSANFTEEMEEAGIRPPENAGDIGPEHLKFVSDDVYGVALLLVSNPQSASITMYSVDCGDSPFTTTTSTEGPDDGKTTDDEGLTTWEFVAIGVGAVAFVSIMALILYMCYCKNKDAVKIHRYTSRDYGHANDQSDAQYVEMEK